MSKGKIRMVYLRDSIYVWDPDDWAKLRQEHRILGNLIGCLAHLPRQNTFPGLPMTLLREEVQLILEKDIGILVKPTNPHDPPSNEMKQKYDDYIEKNHKEQVEYYEELRKKQVTSMIDTIVEGKKRKMMRRLGLGSLASSQGAPIQMNIDIDREEILKAELQKAEDTPPPAMLLQTFTSDPWTTEGDYKEVEWVLPSTPLQVLRYKVFKDLWEKQYYISSGTKFGGDFLVYPGEPVKFHALFIVLCLDRDAKIPMTDMIMHSRIGTSTRKTVVIATTDEEGNITYQSLMWDTA